MPAMSFMERSRDELIELGIDPARLPPGQYHTDRFPVLHAGEVPEVDTSTWDFTVGGLVGQAVRMDFDEFRSQPTETITADIHCVTKWSKFDTVWEGVPTSAILDRVRPDPSATHVMIRAEHGFTANLPLDDFARDGNLFAWRYGGEELEPDHGWPLRLVVPHLYFWKSVKWVRGFDLLDHDEPGFWERNGYHMYGDPFEEQRYWGD
jgi:DMSO/TMAO reductase YedYZ molybdopterin-dependent catalytic subunit